MKTYKTWEIYKKIDENPKEMLGKKFRQVGGMVRDCFWIGDIAEITQYHTLIGFGNLKYEKIRITDLNGFEEWELVQEPVTWQEAIQAWVNGKPIMLVTEYGENVFQSSDATLGCFVRKSCYGFERSDFTKGKWYIGDGEANGY